MSLAITYVDEGRGVLYNVYGVFTGTEALAEASEVNSRDLTANPILYAFTDCSDVSAVEISQRQMFEIADVATAAAKRQKPILRVCAFYSKDDSMVGLGNVLGTLGECTHWETKGFRDRAEAVAWLRERVAALHGVSVNI